MADQVNVLEDGVLDVVGVGVGVGVDVGVGVEMGVDVGVSGGCKVEDCSEELGEEDEVCVAGVIVELVTGV